MSFAVSPGCTNATVGRRAVSLLRAPSAYAAITTSPLSRGQSARLLLAQAFHKRAAPRIWLPLRTIGSSACAGRDEMTATRGQATAA